MNTWLKVVGLLVLVAAAAWALQSFSLREALAALEERKAELGVLAHLILGAAYVLACVLFVPGSLLTLGAGALFGVVAGSITVSIAATLGATAAFLIGRYLARDRVSARVADSPRFAAVDRAVGREGFKIVLLTRLSPVFPFNLLNYAYGVTRVSLRDYVLASWIGMIPGTVMYVYLGDAAGDLATAALVAEGEAERTVGQQALFWGGLVIAVAVTLFVTRIARRALAEEAPALEADAEPASASGGEA